MFSRALIVGLSAGAVGLAFTLSSSAIAAPYTAWQHPYNDTDTNVFAHLHMDETSGTVATDTGTLGIVTNATYSSDASNNVASGAGVPGGDFGRAFDTAGGTRYITVPTNPSSVGSFTNGYVIETWFKTNSTAEAGIAAKWDGTQGDPGKQWELELYQYKLFFASHRSDGTLMYMQGPTTIDTGEWHHVAVQYNANHTGGNQWKMYLEAASRHRLPPLGQGRCNLERAMELHPGPIEIPSHRRRGIDDPRKHRLRQRCL